MRQSIAASIFGPSSSDVATLLPRRIYRYLRNHTMWGRMTYHACPHLCIGPSLLSEEAG
jgi:hypothetical protein